jgi:hypothetical protein
MYIFSWFLAQYSHPSWTLVTPRRTFSAHLLWLPGPALYFYYSEGKQVLFCKENKYISIKQIRLLVIIKLINLI